MKIEVKEISDQKEKEAIAREILYDLPEWFGLPESTEEYIADSREKPFLACYADGKIAGYIVLNATSEACADIFVMGVKKEFHRRGIGSELNAAYEAMARKLGYSYSQVKTVQMGHYDTYDRTNLFYQAMGYRELECFPTLWDEWNPCQIYIKYLGK